MSASLQAAIHESLALATAPQPEEQEYYYDSDDSVVDLDAEFPDISERVVEWHPHDFGKVERACYEREPDLREVLNQSRQDRMAANIPVQLLMPPHQEVPVFELVGDLD